MTLLLNNAEVEKALNPAETIAATESVYRELAEGAAFNRPRSQVYLPVESKANPGFRYRFKSQEGGSPGTGVWALDGPLVTRCKKLEALPWRVEARVVAVSFV